MQGTVGNFSAGQGPALPILISQSFKVKKEGKSQFINLGLNNSQVPSVDLVLRGYQVETRTENEYPGKGLKGSNSFQRSILPRDQHSFFG